MQQWKNSNSDSIQLKSTDVENNMQIFDGIKRNTILSDVIQAIYAVCYYLSYYLFVYIRITYYHYEIFL